VKAGGFLDFALHQVEVECLPVHIPESIKVEVTELLVGQTLHVSDVVAPVGTAILNDPKAPVVSILGRKGGEGEEAAV